MNEIKEYNKTIFEGIKHINENVINKEKIACENSGEDVLDHFVGADKMIKLAKNAIRKVENYNLSCYA